ncbi:MAG: hypothetical protein A2787_02075 [Omnitrophica WOR_2 bacterium RIFCSPHIGHO2_01_FULL_48_9]|nr:MAG: hypothetical protein A3D10_01795 [Omnitrophica WOR_2 bacterium RIFCSPHIGHO2_02_FULL_48_11]OGX34404.1 MAG: hypothetical protein A2787_02075 [Omnitrophica WOR_2 bacterium RIFCSPHIGHO2_01_FULL_48_9]
MSKEKIYFADLTHTAQGISAATFPLGISFVLSYAKHNFGDEFDFQLFKFPADLAKALSEKSPAMLCLSNYSWNFELAYKMATLVKERSPKTVTVFGGPNFPIVNDEKYEFLSTHPAIDFYIELEGEMGFVNLTAQLKEINFDVQRFKEEGRSANNTTYVFDGKVISGPIQRITDVNVIPSPYLTGILDKFFQYPLVPMIETTRGCPFSCTFCADGMVVKNKVHRFEQERINTELEYIASRVKNMDELIITDLNFAMYKEDLDTARAVAEIQKKYHYPILLSASAGKNQPHRTIEAAKILGGSWTLGASIQSTDPEVLKAIKRSNISSAAYQELIDFGNNLKNSKTHSEIILGMPGDTKEKHFQSLRFGIENNVNSMRMFQAMLLRGTDMATGETRKNYGLITKYRIIPGCIGIYEFFGEKHPVAEIEEIIVGNKSMSLEDYIDCRIMNLLVETFHNNAIFEEAFALVRTLGGSPFECLLHVKQHPELYSARINEIIAEFIVHTSKDLYESFDEAKNYVLTPEVLEKYIGGELGTNELLLHRALLFAEFEDICRLLFTSIAETLKTKGILTAEVEGYLEELNQFIVLRKRNSITDTASVFTKSFYYDFLAVSQANFRINPNDFPRLSSPVEFCFFHDEEQKKHIANQVKLYAQTPIGIGRLIQRSNLKLFYRKFIRQDGVQKLDSLQRDLVAVEGFFNQPAQST